MASGGDEGGYGVRWEGEVMKLTLDPSSLSDYETFLKVKALPQYKFTGRTVEFPDEYGRLLGLKPEQAERTCYRPIPGLFDYQEAIARLAIRKRKFATFVEPGLGKTLIQTEFARYSAKQIPKGKAALIVAPSMVVPQTLSEVYRFYGGKLKIDRVKAADLSDWLTKGDTPIGITNFEALKESTPQGRLGSLVIDESSTLKSAYGVWGSILIRLGRGLEWKLAGTGTPAPNDRIEFANHAVLLDHFPTVNSFLARFFVNRGQTDNRWEMKPHALRPFYRALSHWCIFLTNPETYGWKDNAGTLPPIHVHIHDVPMSSRQSWLASQITGTLHGIAGGITSRGQLSQIAKGNYKGEDVPTAKPEYIRKLVESWSHEESTLIWCLYNKEQDTMERMFPGAASIRGETKYEDRVRLLDDFKSGRRRVMISKDDILGFGCNLQVATRMVFSGLQDSYETYWQCIKRANRVGSTKALNVHIPVTQIERPMIETVLLKAKRVQADTEEQERLFKEMQITF